ncbi:MAG TPA: hypothetical protein VN708_24380 [Terriglobales bacterium]|nr:hypothetical protein [Terriglobales bacterium]
MERARKNQPREAMAIVNDHLESPAILIEQLDRDVKESDGKASKAQ